MANVRAYKLAEELGIERTEFVEKVRTLGIDLKSAMASLDDEQCELVREKLSVRSAQGSVTEARVVGGAGRAVIRRRKRTEPPPPEETPAPPVEAASPESEVVTDPDAAVEPAEPSESEEAPVETAPEPAQPDAPEPSPVTPAQPAAAPAQRAASATADRPGAATPANRKGRERKQFKEVVNLREQEQIARQVTSRSSGRPVVAPANPSGAFASPRKRRRDKAPAKKAAAVAKVEKRVVRMESSISVSELAKQLGAKAVDVQRKLMGMGTMVSINQTIDGEIATRIAEAYEFEVQNVGFQESEFLAPTQAETAPESSVPRPPVVTVMGHVDHGKTSLLDAIRKADVVADEAGGITQHIGAYQARVGDQAIAFIDTPGHAAFTAMRARGANATDIVILVVAATEGIMPQTIEAIHHAKAAGVPIVVAVNKCDLPDANPKQARQRLMEHDLIPEEFGGDVLCVDVSALKRTGLDKLLETVLLQAELLELRADPTQRAQGVVLEAQLDKGRGPVATVLIQNGTLSRGDVVVSGTVSGKVRTMLDDHGRVLKEAGPSTPVQVIGLSGVPTAGDPFHAVETDRVAKQIIDHRQEEERRKPGEVTRPRLSLEDLFAQTEAGTVHDLNLIVKADVDGSAEAIRDALEKIESERVKLKVLHAAVGAISESDVQLAEASGAIVIGFHVRPDAAARRLAENQGVDIRVYKVIYELVDEVRNAMAGLLPPTVKEKFLGRAEVRQTFTIPKVGTIAGSYVTEGMFRRSAHCRLLRDGVQLYEGRFASLKRFKDDVREVQNNFECGIGIEGYNDVKVGDVIEAFEYEEEPAEL